jgi:transcription initiation factor IIE alpha subunit
MGDPIPWSDLSNSDRREFANMMNRRFDANITVTEAEKYYGNPEKVASDFGEEATSGGPECPECFSPLYQEDIPHLKRTGCCPNCGAKLVTTDD